MMNSDDEIYKIAKGLLILLIPITFLFFWETKLSLELPIDASKFGTFGDFVGGVLGSFWALCGVLLFYKALQEQRKDFATNNKSLLQQLATLELQTKEFKAQREELELTRNVFNEQAKTLNQQRLESTYFSLLDLYIKGKVNLDHHKKGNDGYFKYLKKKMLHRELQKDPLENHNAAKEIYLDVFYREKDELAQYFRLIYRIIKFIDDSTIGDKEKFKYIKILRSQLSECEMIALYYNSLTDYGGKSYQLILKYNLLKHLSCMSKVEFSRHIRFFKQNSMESKLLPFNNGIISFIENFLITLDEKVKQDDFVEHKLSSNLPLRNDLIIELYTADNNELNIEISKEDNSNISEVFDQNIPIFTQYFIEFLYDTFFFSRYIELVPSIEYIKATTEEKKLTFRILADVKLMLNVDIE